MTSSSLAGERMPRAERCSALLALIVGGVTLGVFVATLAPGLTFDHNGTDGGDLITAAYTLGVPHPTGYPTYTLLAWLFTRLPIGTVAYRVNLLSAVSTAAAAACLFGSARRLLPAHRPRFLLPAATALTFAFASLPWSQAVISEVYALLGLFASLFLWLLQRWREGSSDRWLWLAALVLGLGLGNHITLLFAAPAALILLWPERRRWLRPRVVLPALALFVAGLCVYVYLPLAAAHRPPVNWGHPVTWEQFWWVVGAKQYRIFAFSLDRAAMPARLGTWALLLGDQFGWWGLALALFGGWGWWQRDRALALASVAWVGLIALYAFFYDTNDSHVYLVPAVLLLALWWGEGVRRVMGMVAASRPVWRHAALVIVAILPLVSLALHWSAADPDDDGLMEPYIEQVLDTVEVPGGAGPSSLLVVRSDGPTFALWYGAYVEQPEADVAVVSGPMLAFIWYREHVRYLYPDLIVPEPGKGKVTIDDLTRDLILDNLPYRPVYVTDPTERWEPWFEFVKVEGVALYVPVPR
ncbi:MAG: DUF2723 domain-containing protein [Anaerolineae bacterium]|nr:DUF2723 domain-containing protein [Anaerolineae bacterium]